MVFSEDIFIEYLVNDNGTISNGISGHKIAKTGLWRTGRGYLFSDESHSFIQGEIVKFVIVQKKSAEVTAYI